MRRHADREARGLARTSRQRTFDKRIERGIRTRHHDLTWRIHIADIDALPGFFRMLRRRVFPVDARSNPTPPRDHNPWIRGFHQLGASAHHVQRVVEWHRAATYRCRIRAHRQARADLRHEPFGGQRARDGDTRNRQAGLHGDGRAQRVGRVERQHIDVEHVRRFIERVTHCSDAAAGDAENRRSARPGPETEARASDAAAFGDCPRDRQSTADRVHGAPSRAALRAAHSTSATPPAGVSSCASTRMPVCMRERLQLPEQLAGDVLRERFGRADQQIEIARSGDGRHLRGEFKTGAACRTPNELAQRRVRVALPGDEIGERDKRRQRSAPGERLRVDQTPRVTPRSPRRRRAPTCHSAAHVRLRVRQSRPHRQRPARV